MKENYTRMWLQLCQNYYLSFHFAHRGTHVGDSSQHREQIVKYPKFRPFSVITKYSVLCSTLVELHQHSIAACLTLTYTLHIAGTLRNLFLFYSRLCPSIAGSNPPPESSSFLCLLLSLSILLPVAPQCHLANHVLVFQLILCPLSAIKEPRSKKTSSSYGSALTSLLTSRVMLACRWLSA